MFESINQRNISNLVIDISNNPGGNFLLGVQLLQFLVKDINQLNFHDYQIRFSDLMRKNYESQWNEAMCVLKLENSDDLKGMICMGSDLKDSPLNYLNDSNSPFFMKEVPCFEGKVIFIQNNFTHSSAAMLSSVVMANHLFPIVGEVCSQSFPSSGDFILGKLPRSQLKFGISIKNFQPLNDGERYLNEIIPDYFVERVIGDRDQNKALEFIIANLI